MTNQINVKSISCIFLLLLILSPIVAYADINTPSPLPTGQLNVSYSKQVTATSGTLFVSTVVDGEYGDYPGGNGYRWSVSAGSLPSGITLLSTTGSVDEWYDQGNNYYNGALPAQALLAGVPTQGGTYTFTLKALCYGGSYFEKQFVLAVTAQTLSITTTSLPAGEQNVAYSAQVNKQGGVTPYTWSISNGSLPAGLNINSSTGAITGTPTGSGNSSFTVQVISSDSQTVTKNLSINIVAPCTITTSSPLANGQLSTVYNVQVNASGGMLFVSTVVDGEYGDYPGGNGYRWSVISGSLPTGVTLQSTTGSVDQWYDQGNNYYTGMLPAQAKLYGTPTQSGLYNFTLKALCYGGAYVTKDFSIAVSIPQLVITTNSLPQNTEGRPYNSTLAATGGITPYFWSIVNGTLQTGLALNASTGAITGTPTTNGTANLTFQLTSLDSQTVTKTLSLTIAPPCSVTGNSPLTQAKQGVAYNNVISATGGTLFYSTIVDGEYGDYPFGSGYRWSVISGSLPSGITLQSTNGTAESWYDQGNNYYGGNLPGQAVLAGTSLATGTYLFTIQAIDYYGSYSTMDFVLVVNYDFNIQKQTVPYGRKDVNYSTQLTADGAPVTYTWSIASGSLPPGLTLIMNGNIGVITGTPTMVGNYGFTVHVAGTDVELNPVAIKTYTMEIRDTWDALTGGDHKGQDWTITSTTTIGGEQYGISSFTIAQGITVTIQSGSGMVINAYDISVFGTLQATSDGILQLISENDINIGIDGKVIATRQTNPGPGAGADSQTFNVGANGGSYGGRGGLGAGNASPHSESYGTQYGSDIDTGSKGGNTPVSEIIDPIGGMGGKAVLYAGQNVTIDGEVDVSGEDGENGYVDGYQEPSGGAGGGSGGGILITGQNVILTDNAKLFAYGGSGGHPAMGNTNGGGGGSGGRIKVVCATHNISVNAIISIHGGYAGNENAESGEDGTFAVATPFTSGSVSIDYGAQTTDKRAARLTILAQNDRGVYSMQLRNDNGEWFDWIGYNSTVNWLLTEGNGVKTVSVRFCSFSGLISEIYSDSITFDSTPHEFPITDPEADPPEITVTSPLENTTGHNYTIGDIISISYNATDNGGIVYQSATLNGYSVPNNAQIDATHLGAGENTLVIKAVNSCGIITEKTVNFNIKITVESVMQVIDRYYHNYSHIYDQSTYESLNTKLAAINNSLNQGQSQTARDQINELIGYIYSQMHSTITVHHSILLDFYMEHLLFRASIPTNLYLYFSSRTDLNDVNLTLVSGTKAKFELSGNLTVQLTPTSNPDSVSLSILHSEYAGTPLVVDSVNYGPLYFTNDVDHPSIGTLDLIAGKIIITENVIAKNAYLQALGIASVPLSIPQTGTFLPVIFAGRVHTAFSITMPSYLPVVANGNGCGGTITKPPEPSTQPPTPTPPPPTPVTPPKGYSWTICPHNIDPNTLKTRDVDITDQYYPKGPDGSWKHRDIDNDDNEDSLISRVPFLDLGWIETWVTAQTYRRRFVTNDGKIFYIGACKYPGGLNIPGGTVEDDGIVIIWYNIEPNKDRGWIAVTEYRFNTRTLNLTITVYHVPYPPGQKLDKDKPETLPKLPPSPSTKWDEKYNKTAPSNLPDLNRIDIDPPCDPVGFLCPYVYLYVGEKITSPATWKYTMESAKIDVKPGDTIKIAGVGITGASVSDDAASDEFGAWRVKESTDTHVIFEVTKEAFINRSFGGFSVIAPNAVEGITPVITTVENFSYSGNVLGPIGMKIE